MEKVIKAYVGNVLLCPSRFYGNTFAFSVVSLGNVPMPAPITVSYSDSIGQPSTGNRTMLLHWNPGTILYFVWVSLKYPNDCLVILTVQCAFENWAQI